MSEINENFYVNNVQNCDSVYMYGILNTNKEGLKYDLPSVNGIASLIQMVLPFVKSVTP